MKKNLVIGTLLISTIISAAAPAMADRSAVGAAIGAGIGAIIGSQVGQGNGNKAAIVIGAIAGAVAGNQIGRELDQNDRRAYEDAQRHCFDSDLGQREWRGQSARGHFRTMQEGYRGSQVCRSYESVVDYGYKVERTSGVACRDNRGFWQNVEQTEVDFRGNRGDYGGRDRDRDRWDNNRPGRRDDRRDDFRPSPPARGGSDTTEVRGVTRRGGGEWIRLSLRRPEDVSSVELRVRGAELLVYRAIAYTTSGREIEVYVRDSRLSPFGPRSAGVLDVRSREEITAIDINVESMGGYADVEFTVFSDNGRPRVDASRL